MDDAGGNGTDRAFAEEMVPYHQGAIDMERVALERADYLFDRRTGEQVDRSTTCC